MHIKDFVTKKHDYTASGGKEQGNVRKKFTTK